MILRDSRERDPPRPRLGVPWTLRSAATKGSRSQTPGNRAAAAQQPRKRPRATTFHESRVTVSNNTHRLRFPHSKRLHLLCLGAVVEDSLGDLRAMHFTSGRAGAWRTRCHRTMSRHPSPCGGESRAESAHLASSRRREALARSPRREHCNPPTLPELSNHDRPPPTVRTPALHAARHCTRGTQSTPRDTNQGSDGVALPLDRLAICGRLQARALTGLPLDRLRVAGP